MRIIRTWEEQEFLDQFVGDGWFEFQKWIDSEPDVDVFILIGNNGLRQILLPWKIILRKYQKRDS